MPTGDYASAYELLNNDAEDDLRTLEELVNDAIEAERSMTSSSLPEGFEVEMTDNGDFGFKATKKYDNGVVIDLQYDERSRVSFSRPDSSSVEINVQLDYNITEHWDQRM